MAGTLYVISTPIGNLEDLSRRAARLLSEVTLIAAEDTRHTKNLLNACQINTPLTSYHDFNKEEKAPLLVARLRAGDSIALVVDAGTPTISDPGYYLINQAIAADIPLCPIPGPTAAMAALSVSGLPTDRFAFEGFLPRKKGARAKRLTALQDDPRTLIFYESPHRIMDLLDALYAHFGNRRVVLCREMTKKFEEIVHGDIKEVLERGRGKKMLGEITLVVEGMRAPPSGGKQQASLDTLVSPAMTHTIAVSPHFPASEGKPLTPTLVGRGGI